MDSLSKGSILLVDDSATSRILVKLYLTGMAFDFLESARGDEALEQLKSVKVSLIIADVNMPGMDGLTFLKHVRENTDPVVRALPVILLTGDKTEATRNKGTAAGASAFVTKPVTTTELRAAVHQFLPT